MIVSKFGQVDANHYLDPRSNQVFHFDHVRQIASELQPSGSPDAQRYGRDENAGSGPIHENGQRRFGPC